MSAATFKSLLYEACGRVVDPIFGSSGLLWSGNWSRCQAAVEAVLEGGSPIATVGFNGVVEAPAFDIRHVNKSGIPGGATETRQVRSRAKRGGGPSHDSDESNFSTQTVENGGVGGGGDGGALNLDLTLSLGSVSKRYG